MCTGIILPILNWRLRLEVSLKSNVGCPCCRLNCLFKKAGICSRTSCLGWFSEHSSLKPFTYPVPETRFFHAGANVYKFKIKYGNSMSVNIDFHESIVNEELQDAIRVILGNLNDLCPFTTEHLIIFPYLNQWEKVSDLRFMRGDTFLVPYPYVCTVYVELNLLKRGALWGKAGCREACNSDNSGSDQKDNVDTERTIKWRRLEDTVEISHPRISRGRNVTKNTTCIHDTAKLEVDFENKRLREDAVYPTLVSNVFYLFFTLDRD
ncbi:membrane-anchored junction protein isoform X1 [Podarcis muralis]